MAIKFHPEIGTIVICDFNGFIVPEMVKRRPVIIVSPRLRDRDKLCTIVPLSTTPPSRVMAYHYKLKLDKPLPAPYDASFHWVKGDMVTTVSLNRLFMPFIAKDKGKREYDNRVIDVVDLRNIRACILHALNLSCLTGHL